MTANTPGQLGFWKGVGLRSTWLVLSPTSVKRFWSADGGSNHKTAKNYDVPMQYSPNWWVLDPEEWEER